MASNNAPFGWTMNASTGGYRPPVANSTITPQPLQFQIPQTGGLQPAQAAPAPNPYMRPMQTSNMQPFEPSRQAAGNPAIVAAEQARWAEQNARKQGKWDARNARMQDMAGQRWNRDAFRTENYLDNYARNYATAAINNQTFAPPNMKGKVSQYMNITGTQLPSQDALAQAVARLQQQYLGSGWANYPGLNFSAGANPVSSGQRQRETRWQDLPTNQQPIGFGGNGVDRPW